MPFTKTGSGSSLGIVEPKPTKEDLNQPIKDAGAEYERTGVVQEVILPAGTIRYTPEE